MSVFITCPTTTGHQAIIAQDHIVSIVEKDEETVKVLMMDQTQVDLAISIAGVWRLIQ